MVLRAKPQRKEEKDRTREELLRAALRLGEAHGRSSAAGTSDAQSRPHRYGYGVLDEKLDGAVRLSV